MRSSYIIVLVLAATGSTMTLRSSFTVDNSMSNLPDFSLFKRSTTKSTSCPSIWTKISTRLSNDFEGCTDIAKGTIRAAFHDCAAWSLAQGTTGGCDGSLLLSGELSRSENLGLQPAATYLLNLRNSQYPSVSVADFIQLAASVAIVTCPGGPRVKTYVGRVDSSALPPHNLLPVAKGAGSDAKTILKLFQNKGFTAAELAALIGAHTCSKQFFVDPSKAGYSQDSSPQTWDVGYYEQTLEYATTNESAPGVFTFPSDANLASDESTPVAAAFQRFVGEQTAWGVAFAAAMSHMSLLGVPNTGSLVDCTSVIPAATKSRRDFLSPHGRSSS